jgi:glycosyltransferase involved in cell wall biosynthesis
MAASSKKRVLMVAYHYPPEHSSSGVLRTLKFSKYLPEQGWEPFILTVRERYFERTDPALVRQISSPERVFRTSAIDTKKAFSIRGKYLRFFTIPDRFIGWLPFAVLAGLRIIRRNQVDAIYSTSPLGTAHLIASLLKTMTRIPWLADFRDPWIEPELEPDRRRPLFRLESFLERLVMNKADRLVFTTAQLRDSVVARHSSSAHKALVIPNGYDEEDFAELPDCKPDTSPIRITHTGLVDGAYRSPRTFLEGLAQLIRRDEIPMDRIRVDFLGDSPYLESAEFHNLVEQLGLQQVVTSVGRVSYACSLLRQARSHVLLLLQCGSDTRTLIPAKAFEYLRVGRPILALVPPSASSELFERVGGARVVDPLDSSGIERALSELYRAACAGIWKSNLRGEALMEYDRRKLTSLLARELDGLARPASRK